MPLSFGDCELHPDCFELRRRGRPVKLEPKVFDVLSHLIEHRDRVVTKHELLDALWPGEAVSDSVLPRCIAALRRAVGDNRSRQKVIATSHGRGYRFVASLAAEKAVPSDSSRPPAPPVEREAPASSSSRAEFVGRVDAMARVEAARERAERGEGGVVLIVGEPGIGKTRLTEEAAARARRAGFEVFVGGCYEGEGAPAYWPWLQILRDTVAATPNEETLLTQLGSGAAEIAELLPELSARFEGLEPAGGPPGEQARFRLYDAATRFLAARSKNAPLCLILDDLHWADASSLGLLRFLVRSASQSQMLILGTYRDVEVRRGSPLADLLGSLAREPNCERVALGGLDVAEIASFVHILAGEAPREDLLVTLSEMTEGNPFFLLEMVRLLAEQGDAAQAGRDELNALSLPQGVKDAIGRRLDALSPECNAMLRSAAVIGRHFRVAILQSMLDLPEIERADALLELLAEALDAGAIVEAERGSYSFGHALTRQTLYEELRAPARIALHRRAGQALEASLDPAFGNDAHLAELAHHFFEAAPGGDVDKAIDYAARAAEASDGKYAYDEAVAFHQRALDALELRLPMDEEKRAKLLLALGEAQLTAGRRSAAFTTLRASADLARSCKRRDLLARAAIALRGFGEFGSWPEEGVIALVQEALDGLPKEAYALRSRLLSRLNGNAAISMEERSQLSRRALEIAQQSGDPLALRDALSARWWATMGPDRLEERREVALALRQLAEQTRDPRALLLALECEFGMNLVLGDFSGTECNLDEYERAAAELRQPLFIFLAMSFRTSWLISRGHFEAAEARVQESLEYGRDVVPFAETMCIGLLSWSRGVRGINTEVPVDAEELGMMMRHSVREEAYEIFLASLAYSIERDVDKAIERLSAIDLRMADRDEHWLLAMTLAAGLAVDAGAVDLMEWLYSELVPYAELMAIHDLMRAGRGSVASALGRLAAGLGDLDASVDFLRRAIEKERAADMRPARVESELWLAWTLRERGAVGDRAASDALAKKAAAEARVLGLQTGLLEILETG